MIFPGATWDTLRIITHPRAIAFALFSDVHSYQKGFWWCEGGTISHLFSFPVGANDQDAFAL
jgi:hypothetical protein